MMHTHLTPISTLELRCTKVTGEKGLDTLPVRSWTKIGRMVDRTYYFTSSHVLKSVWMTLLAPAVRDIVSSAIGDAECFSFLAERMKETKEPMTSSSMFTYMRQQIALDYLLSPGAIFINTKTGKPSTPAENARDVARAMWTIQILVEQHADVNKTFNSASLLRVAGRMKRRELIGLLLEHGARITLSTSDESCQRLPRNGPQPYPPTFICVCDSDKI
ncbi:hypothetical protein BDN70DRAFT_899685 [Pholiota conissans]|uniref:Uncharacterized protein n=1 Tax=Pholiota conissans TaxID=109636 RepID=A0A9P6CUV2_9AGAR|nr:hypothetical protein BDN70DRAFT_899685 [Pholiota conissans]